MPCRDYYDDHPEAYFKDVTEPALKKQISFAESALCQTLAAFERILKETKDAVPGRLSSDPLDFINYEEAGITKKQLKFWWLDHKKLDAKHRAEELKKTALTKLTKEEVDALVKLGLKL